MIGEFPAGTKMMNDDSLSGQRCRMGHKENNKMRDKVENRTSGSRFTAK